MTATGTSNDVFVLAPAGFSDPTDAEMTNLALLKPATQSSTDPTWAGGAQRAVDGVLTGNHNSVAGGTNPNGTTNTCTHTTASTDRSVCDGGL